MKSVFYLYRDLEQMLGKYRLYIKPELFEDAFEFASTGLFDEYYGNTKDYAPGRPLPRVGFQLTTAVNSALHPFKREVFYGRDQGLLGAGEIVVGPDGRTAKYLPLGDDGTFALPADLVHPTALLARNVLVEVLDDNEVATVLTSLVDPPNAENPKVEVVPGGLKLYPASVSEVRMPYLGKPVRVKYAVSYDSGEPIYDDEASIDTDWPPARHNQLLTRMLQYPALGLRDNQVQQIAQNLTDRGA